jgi:predicted  nucleic acid-binding Zn ribbon protein
MRLAQVMLVCSTNPSTVELTVHTTVESMNKLLQVIVEIYRYLAQLINREVGLVCVWDVAYVVEDTA